MFAVHPSVLIQSAPAAAGLRFTLHLQPAFPEELDFDDLQYYAPNACYNLYGLNEDDVCDYLDSQVLSYREVTTNPFAGMVSSLSSKILILALWVFVCLDRSPDEIARLRLETLAKDFKEDSSGGAGFVTNCTPQAGRQLGNIVQYGFTGLNTLNTVNILHAPTSRQLDRLQAVKVLRFYVSCALKSPYGFTHGLYNADLATRLLVDSFCLWPMRNQVTAWKVSWGRCMDICKPSLKRSPAHAASIYAKAQLIDHESIYFCCRALLSLYEVTKSAYFRTGAIRAAQLSASWMLLWVIPLPPKSTLACNGFRSTGWVGCDTAGARYMHPMGTVATPDLVRTAQVTGDTAFLDIAESSASWHPMRK